MAGTVFLLDVDNTLLDNDTVSGHLRAHLCDRFGEERAGRYWSLFEELRAELGYADYLGALQRFRLVYPHEPHMLELSPFLLEYPFPDRVFPGAFDVVAAMWEVGTPVILSDGDVVFQPRKVRRSGLGEAMRNNVLIYVHKEHELEDVSRRFPADRYVLVDDKLRILAAIKRSWGDRVQTVFVRQGHYALDPEIVERYPPADVSVDAIGDLLPLVSELAAA
jgi:hypothetical protein